MPEGDTIHAAAARIRAVLGPGPIVAAEGSRLIARRNRLIDAPITRVWSHGKHTIIEAGDWAIRAHLRMHGRWTTHEPGWRPKPSGSLRAMVASEHGAAACWAAPDVAVDKTMSIHNWLDTNVGPDLIRSDVDDAMVASALSDPARPIAEVLLDQRIAAGIGNVFKSELCFRARINPETPVGELDEPAVRAIFDDAAHLLRLNSHRRDRLTTKVDRPGRRQAVYGRVGRGCPACNTPIERRTLGERVTFWCPRCQPTDRAHSVA